MSFIGLLKPTGPSGFGHNATAMHVTADLDLSDKSYLITGCNSGLGLETLRVLTSRGARVIATARTLEKAKLACRAAGARKRELTTALACELSDPNSIRVVVDSVKSLGLRLDGIIANAGIMALPRLVQNHGIESQFFTNHVGHFLLVTSLLSQLTCTGRVVMVSSSAHRGTYQGGLRLDDLSGELKGYTPWGAYGQSKLANLLFAKSLAKRLPQPGQRANSVHPGVIMTNLGRHSPLFSALRLVQPLFLKTIPQGAATQCFATAHPHVNQFNGEFLVDCNLAKPSAHGRDAQLAEDLWDATEKIVARL